MIIGKTVSGEIKYSIRETLLIRENHNLQIDNITHDYINMKIEAPIWNKVDLIHWDSIRVSQILVDRL